MSLRTIEMPIGKRLSEIENGSRLSGEWRTGLPASEIRKLEGAIVETTIEKTESPSSPKSSLVVTEPTPSEGLQKLSMTCEVDASPALRLIDSSASALHDHMKKILNQDNLDDVRPTLDRTEQAVSCAREIALLMKAKADLIRAVRE